MITSNKISNNKVLETFAIFYFVCFYLRINKEFYQFIEKATDQYTTFLANYLKSEDDGENQKPVSSNHFHSIKKTQFPNEKDKKVYPLNIKNEEIIIKKDDSKKNSLKKQKKHCIKFILYRVSWR